MNALGYFAAILMGMTLGTIGGGGSILTVPILVYLFSVSPTDAAAHSLFIVGSTALAGFLSYARRREVSYAIATAFFVPGFAGVYLMRNLVMPSIPAHIAQIGPIHLTRDLLVMVVFAILMLFSAIAMIRPRSGSAKGGSPSGWLAMTLRGFFVGCVTGFVGAGGGFLLIPALVFLAHLPMRKAVGTSLLVIAANSLAGFFSSLGRGVEPPWGILFRFTAIAIVGILLGAAFSERVPEKKLKTAFGWFVLLVGSLIMIQQLANS